jgi:hypothetical protein
VKEIERPGPEQLTARPRSVAVAMQRYLPTVQAECEAPLSAGRQERVWVQAVRVASPSAQEAPATRTPGQLFTVAPAGAFEVCGGAGAVVPDPVPAPLVTASPPLLVFSEEEEPQPASAAPKAAGRRSAVTPMSARSGGWGLMSFLT